MMEINAWCSNCRFARLVQHSPLELTKVRQCFYGPPSVVAVVLPGGKIGMRNCRPIMEEREGCFQFKPTDELRTVQTTLQPPANS